jgi:sarcosine oxidase delta subunit
VQLEVTFEAREDDSGQKSEVWAHCEGGVPHFESRTEHAAVDE